MHHSKYDLGSQPAEAVVVVTLRNQANVLLMDSSNYRTYSSSRGGRYRYTGGSRNGRLCGSGFRIQATGTWRSTLVVPQTGRGERRGRAAATRVLPPIRQSSKVLRQIQHGEPEPPPADVLGGRTWDVFVCHASEDKDEVARPLADAPRALGVSVWLDEVEMKVGDSLRRKIDQGIRSSRFGLVTCLSGSSRRGGRSMSSTGW